MSDILKDLYKVNSRQIFLLWKNFAVSMLVPLLMIIFTIFTPSIFAPVISTLACVVMYAMVYSKSFNRFDTCLVMPYTTFITLITYTVITLGINLLNVWYLLDIPEPIVFFQGYFIPILILAPCGFVDAIIMYVRRHKLSVCRDCRLQNDASTEKGRVGIIFSNESELQLKNLILIYAILTAVGWIYYFTDFVDVSLSNRDTFVFFIITCIVYLSDILFFAIRYYNLYLDLKERDELVSPSDLQHISPRTYIRFYVICGDYILLNSHSSDELREIEGEILDTPFIVKQIVKGIPENEVKKIIERLTRIDKGALRFFFGRKVNDIGDHSILRYFYLLPGEPSDYPELKAKGEWLSSEKFKTIFNTSPVSLSSGLIGDMNRLATIIVTSKIFKENGERRNKLMQYRPTFSFSELYNTHLDFQNELWIQVSLYNSDSRFFRLKRWLRQNEKKSTRVPFKNPPV